MTSMPADRLISLAGSLAQAAPGQGLGLRLGIAGALLCVLSVALYTPRNRLTSLQGAGPKRYWLNLHILLGAAGPLLVAGHAHLQLLGFKGLANLAMWGTVFSGVLARFLTTRTASARHWREQLLKELEDRFAWDDEEALFFLRPAQRRRTRQALREGFGAQPMGPGRMVLLFFRDLQVLWALTRASRRLHQGMQLLPGDRRRAERRQEAVGQGEVDGRRSGERRVPPEAFRARLILRRNLLLLNIYEASAPFWIAVHSGFTLAFLLFLNLHMAVALLFKPQFALW